MQTRSATRRAAQKILLPLEEAETSKQSPDERTLPSPVEDGTVQLAVGAKAIPPPADAGAILSPINAGAIQLPTDAGAIQLPVHNGTVRRPADKEAFYQTSTTHTPQRSPPEPADQENVRSPKEDRKFWLASIKNATNKRPSGGTRMLRSAAPGVKRHAEDNEEDDYHPQAIKRVKAASKDASSTQEIRVDLPHGLGSYISNLAVIVRDENSFPNSCSDDFASTRKNMTAEDLEKASKRYRRLKKPTTATVDLSEANEEAIDKAGSDPDSTDDLDSEDEQKVVKEKDYGLMPGETPYRDWPGPSAGECQVVYDILVQEYQKREKSEEPAKHKALNFIQPAAIPPASANVAGCGEVPCLVDAMMRTIISQSVTRESADKVIENIIKLIGMLDKKGPGPESINWNALRKAPKDAVLEAFRPGGLGPTKYNAIKTCLSMIRKDNKKRAKMYLKEKETKDPSNSPGTARLSPEQRDHQLSKINAGILTLDHIRIMKPHDAMLELVKYPQVAVKTASCLLLFNLQMPSFAVDTHVHRMTRWLGWAPMKASPNDTYMHCDFRVPDHLKYGLHQLFIEHGGNCYRCQGSTVEGTTKWNSTVCPLEHLLARDKKQTQAKVKNKSVRESGTLDVWVKFTKPQAGVSGAD
ncbi:HhH-GPD family base excision DNA repair protein [Colletotrichum paranaense]|uniref:HhH-GPD family base excision DNA repair protein n=1 Tax=Colletotrichum paranaense TaxID=1914294 RepID=A0ABQ9SDR5_9PEZI|nr:HhH-GPD family base excision DNA repair protein [Colletotrichum paranaense]KAK1533633.1 HhH-GPD family base excision DNA repair protein [Colletotrichum paranaense]